MSLVDVEGAVGDGSIRDASGGHGKLEAFRAGNAVRRVIEAFLAMIGASRCQNNESQHKYQAHLVISKAVLNIGTI